MLDYFCKVYNVMKKRLQKILFYKLSLMFDH